MERQERTTFLGLQDHGLWYKYRFSFGAKKPSRHVLVLKQGLTMQEAIDVGKQVVERCAFDIPDSPPFSINYGYTLVEISGQESYVLVSDNAIKLPRRDFKGANPEVMRTSDKKDIADFIEKKTAVR